MTVSTMPAFSAGLDDTDPLSGLTHPADLDGPARPGPAAGDDPEAPYGRKADGTPRSKPGRKPGPSMTGTRRTTPRPAPQAQAPAPGPRPAGAPRPSAQAPKAPKKGAPDYRAGVAGLFQLAAAPLVVAGLRNDAAAADAAALTMHAEPIAQAVHDLATNDARVASVLDRLLAVGPYGALLAATMPLVAQVAANHGVLPPALAAGFGAVDPGELTRQMRGDMLDRMVSQSATG